MRTGNPEQDAQDHLRNLDRLPLQFTKCDLCGEKAPEDCVTKVKETLENICNACIATLTIEQLTAMSVDDVKARARIVEQLYPLTKTKGT